MQSTEWRPIEGFESYYEVSDDGRVRSLDRIVRRGYTGLFLMSGKELRPYAAVDGYPRVTLHENGAQISRRVHRVVALAFLGAPELGQEVCHSDGDKMNNSVSNLRWGSSSENTQDMLRQGHHRNQNTGKTYCQHGHEFTEANTRHYRGTRSCRTCARLSIKAIRLRRKLES